MFATAKSQKERRCHHVATPSKIYAVCNDRPFPTNNHLRYVFLMALNLPKHGIKNLRRIHSIPGCNHIETQVINTVSPWEEIKRMAQG